MQTIENKFSDQFYSLTPGHMLDAIDNLGLVTSGRYIQLNSYENRVLDIELEPENPFNNHIIAKFYRPGRWSREAIAEEHGFLSDLKSDGITVVAPIKLKQNTVHEIDNIFIGLFPKALGRMPQELFTDDFKKIGRLLARIHNIGEQKQSKHRMTLTMDNYGYPSLEILKNWVAQEVWVRYEKAALQIFDYLDENLDESQFIRIHGDCHKGNILQTDPKEGDKEYFFVDFDDFCNGPTAQDFWMLFSGQEEDTLEEQEDILSGYEELRNFKHADLKLMKPLRGLRIIYYAAWIARRWQDPSFPNLFPQFKDYNYWAEEVEVLERIAWSL